jgi:hypothetical protein
MVAAALEQAQRERQGERETEDKKGGSVADLSTNGDETRRGGATVPIGVGIGLDGK